MESISKNDRSKLWLELWRDLFSSPIHLDSAISKRPGPAKGWLAESFGVTLRRPTQVFKEAGIRTQGAEWWNWSPEQLAEWEGARKLSVFWSSFSSADAIRSRFKSGLAVESDYPPEVLKKWVADFGPEVAKRLVDQFGQPPRVSVRLTQALSPEEFLTQVKADSIHLGQAKPSRWAARGIVFNDYAPVLSAPATKDGFEKGLFEIQDEGSQVMAAFALDPLTQMSLLSDRPTQSKPSLDLEALRNAKAPSPLNVIDACAGAGGKTLALADLLHGRGRVYAYDTSLKKIQALKKRVRGQASNIQAMTIPNGEETQFLKKYAASADIVLVDAPCSGWGVFRRNPDIKWRQDREKLSEMPEIQLRLLGEYQALVKKGGRLVFGVCTFRPEESTAVVEAFGKKHPEFKSVGGGYLGPESCDGFYMFAWERS
ncbi:MAG: hypothetical protein JNL01_08530 [Bdellovibrionales bacterium]|nr:hypothetical protein [Bdellovibrionales bacterium]